MYDMQYYGTCNMLLEKVTFSVSLIRWSTWSNIFIELQTNCVISIARKNFENSKYYFKNTKMKNILWKYKDSKYYMYRENKIKTQLRSMKKTRGVWDIDVRDNKVSHW